MTYYLKNDNAYWMFTKMTDGQYVSIQNVLKQNDEVVMTDIIELSEARKFWKDLVDSGYVQIVKSV